MEHESRGHQPGHGFPGGSGAGVYPGKPGGGEPIGVLALQGDFALHAQAIGRAGGAVCQVRTPQELDTVNALILPGGESTAMLKLMEKTDMEAALVRFAERGGALFGTCAGIILLAKAVAGPRQRSLGILDVDVDRNAYGRQVQSFETDLQWTEDPGTVRGVFIRAPRISRVGDGVRVLAHHDGHPVLVRKGRVLACTFHPELTTDIRLHRYFGETVGSGRTGAVS